MIDGVMRLLHVPWWVPFIVWFGLYIFTAMGWVINGYAQEYLGWRHPGRPGKIHKVLVRFHTGAHVQPEKSHGDERRLRRVAGNVSRATPEGAMVYWTPHSRGFRAIRNNLIIFLTLVLLSLFVDYPKTVVVLITLIILASFAYMSWRMIAMVRKRREAQRPVAAVVRPAKAKVFINPVSRPETWPGETTDKKPQLDGVPKNVLASLIAQEMVCSSAEILNRLTMDQDQGQLILPDTFAARVKQRESVQELIEGHTKGSVKFEWITTEAPRRITWIPVIKPKLPSMVRFRDYLDKIEALGKREIGVGVNAARDVYIATHNGDAGPWHCRFAGPGTGKSTGFLVKAAQIAHKDPTADIYGIDTKQVSFTYLKDIPRIYIFDNPQSEMDKMWDIFYTLAGIMDDRYTAVREKRKRFDDFNDIWLFADEGNDLGAQLKSFNKNVLGGTTAGAPIWGEAIARLLRMGRQCHIYGEFMFQDLDGRLFNGETLKSAFSVYGAAGFTEQQFTRTVGSPAEKCLEGPGKILMCRGNKREWVQGFYDDENWLHEYALENRK
jgi:hypothetical protein